MPYSVPTGRFVLPRCKAVATSSIPIPRIASAEGSSCARTAYFCSPVTSTCATPLIVEIYFFQRGLARHSGRKLPRCRRNRRLYVLSGSVDVPAQIELQSDLGIAQGAGRADGIESSNR